MSVESLRIMTVQMYGVIVPRGQSNSTMAYTIRYPFTEMIIAITMIVLTVGLGVGMAVVALVAFKGIDISLLVTSIGLLVFLLFGEYVLLWRTPADYGKLDEHILLQRIVDPLEEYLS